MKLLFLILILFIPQNLNAELTKETIMNELCFLSLLANDWQQTLDIKNNPNMYEKNKILGKHPTDEKVNLYFASCAVFHSFIAFTIPDRYDKVWQLIWIGIESKQISENDDIGLKQDYGVAYNIRYSIIF